MGCFACSPPPPSHTLCFLSRELHFTFPLKSSQMETNKQHNTLFHNNNKRLIPPVPNSICIKALVTMDSFKPTQYHCPAAWKTTGSTPQVVVLAHPTGSQMAQIFQTANLIYVESTGHGVLCLQRREPLQSDHHYVAIWQSFPLTYGLGIGMAVTPRRS